MIRFARSAFVIARRDFGATVLSKAFVLFLIGPLFPLLLGGVFGGIGARVASQTDHPVVAVVSSADDFERLSDAREDVADALSDPSVVTLVHYAPEGDLADQQHRLLGLREPPVRAVLSGGLDDPHLIGALADDPATVGQLKLIINEARAPQMQSHVIIPVKDVQTSSGAQAKDRALTAQIGEVLIFLFTVLLAGALLSQLIEEKSNKIIEVIAAAVPIDALFVGKLFAMLAASLVGIVVWLTAGALLINFIKHGGIATLAPPAVGWPTFIFLGMVYFAMNYLLLGSAFLTIGAQASTAREVQTMAMPVTFAQVVLFGFASTAVGAPGSAMAFAAAVFPLSSPMTMLARAAQEPQLLPHLVAIVWQLLWVAVILRFGSLLFRKTVLKSGPRLKWRRTRKT